MVEWQSKGTPRYGWQTWPSGLHNGLKAIYGPKTSAVSPVRSADGCQLYTNVEDIKTRWKEHFCNFLNQQEAADSSACHKITMRPHHRGWIGEGTKSTRGSKALGQHGISAELWKHGELRLRKELLKLFNARWPNECIPQDFKDAVMITIDKKKRVKEWMW